jgi:hypothetical protein
MVLASLASCDLSIPAEEFAVITQLSLGVVRDGPNANTSVAAKS